MQDITLYRIRRASPEQEFYFAQVEFDDGCVYDLSPRHPDVTDGPAHQERFRVFRGFEERVRVWWSCEETNPVRWIEKGETQITDGETSIVVAVGRQAVSFATTPAGIGSAHPHKPCKLL